MSSKVSLRKDSKKAIKAFIHHVESLENAQDPEVDGFEAEYKLIQDAQIRNKRDNIFSMEIGKSDNNLKKNRYKDILPYDKHRVILSAIEGDQDSGYINASTLMGVRGTGGYIATQGPLAVTVQDFWRMIWEYNVEIVFMACRIVEMGKIKCKQYWNDESKSEEFENISVFTEKEEKIMSDCVQRNFRVTKGEEVRAVVQYHYSGWPDHGIPDDAGHIRDMIGLMRNARQNVQAPLLVHCSAGCGRTGAIIAIDYVWTLLEEGMFDESFSLFDLICNFREQRMSIVQTSDQYALVNKVLKSLCEDWLTRMASHTYENVALDEVSNSESLAQTNDTKSGKGQDKTGSNNHFQEKSSLHSSPNKSTQERQGSDIKGYLTDKTHTSQSDKENFTSIYTNLPQAQCLHQQDVDSSKDPPATSELSAPRTFVEASPAPASELGGYTESPYAVVYDVQSPPAVATKPPELGLPGKAKKSPSVSSQPGDTVSYSNLDKTLSKSLVDEAANYSIVNKKLKAPLPPNFSPKTQQPPADVTYSVVTKKSSASETRPPSTPRTPNSPDPESVYTFAKEIGSDSVFTPYEDINYLRSVDKQATNRSANKVSDGVFGSTSSYILSLGQTSSAFITNFNERLPRVRGPVPMPQSWSKTLSTLH